MNEVTEARKAHARGDIRTVVEEYRGFHENGGGSVDARKGRYVDMVRGYYDLVTDFYEKGWGDSFHFAPRFRGEPFVASLRRHQHFIALKLGLGPAMRALDAGCGVGGPLREIARFSGAHVTGVNNNAYQLEKARRYNREARLDDRTALIEADFMSIPVASDSFDAVYAFEATCHSPDKTGLFRELYRVLKPSGKIAIYEWCLTDRYDVNNKEHVKIKRDIEEGNGLPDIATIRETAQCFADAGFSLIEHADKAFDGDRELPWYFSLTGKEFSNTGLRRSRMGKAVLRGVTRSLEAVKVAPKGTAEVSEFLNVGADALVRGGELSVFTPMAFFLAQKPAASA